MSAQNCTCRPFYAAGSTRDLYTAPLGFAWVSDCPAHGPASAWFKKQGQPAPDQLHADGPRPPKGPTRRSSFVVSPPAQHEFRVLGGERPSGARAAAKAAYEQAGIEMERRAQAARDRRAAKSPR
jgi:hypothetical protein